MVFQPSAALGVTEMLDVLAELAVLAADVPPLGATHVWLVLLRHGPRSFLIRINSVIWDFSFFSSSMHF